MSIATDTVMTSASISTIPLELRHQIYRELVITCLSEECGSDISGIYFSCRQFHTEVEDECISKARPLLDILHEWKTEWRTKHDKTGKLHFHLANKGNFAESIALIGITMPSTVFPRDINDYRTDQSFTAAVKCLRRAFRLPHSTLRLGVSVTHKDTAGTVVESLCKLLRCLFMNYDGEPAFDKTKRLIFQFWFRNDIPYHAISRIRSSMKWALGPVEFEHGERAWVAKKHDEGGRVLWSCGFDAEDGLPEVEGIVPQHGDHTTN
jgi:hypothetical protein